MARLPQWQGLPRSTYLLAGIPVILTRAALGDFTPMHIFSVANKRRQISTRNYQHLTQHQFDVTQRNFRKKQSFFFNATLNPRTGVEGAILVTPPGCRFLHTFSYINSRKYQPEVSSGQVTRSSQVTQPKKIFMIAP